MRVYEDGCKQRRKGRVEHYEGLNIRGWSRQLYSGNQIDMGFYIVTVQCQSRITVSNKFKHLTDFNDAQIEVSWTICCYGSMRPWFCCPACKKRFAVLYFASNAFACRKCLNLAYTSQSMSPVRRLRNARSIIYELVGNGGLNNAPTKPKGMRRITYRRVLATTDKLRHFL